MIITCSGDGLRDEAFKILHSRGFEGNSCPRKSPAKYTHPRTRFGFFRLPIRRTAMNCATHQYIPDHRPVVAHGATAIRQSHRQAVHCGSKVLVGELRSTVAEDDNRKSQTTSSCLCYGVPQRSRGLSAFVKDEPWGPFRRICAGAHGTGRESAHAKGTQ